MTHFEFDMLPSYDSLHLWFHLVQTILIHVGQIS